MHSVEKAKTRKPLNPTSEVAAGILACRRGRASLPPDENVGIGNDAGNAERLRLMKVFFRRAGRATALRQARMPAAIMPPSRRRCFGLRVSPNISQIPATKFAALSLAPGFSRVFESGRGTAASAASGTGCGKPLKRFRRRNAFDTRLKPGANEIRNYRP